MRFKVMGRGELQLAILIEMMRREGFEMMVGKPEILTKRIDGKTDQEPVELLVIDCPEAFIGVVIEKMGSRKGKMTKMINNGSGRVRLEFHDPVARADRFAQRNADGHAWDGHHEFAVPRLYRMAGRHPDAVRRVRWSRIAPARRRATRFSTCRSAARFSSRPGTEVYEGMIVGENARR